MILTGAKLEQIGFALYGEIWVSKLSVKLCRAKRTIMRWRDSPSGLPLDVQRQLLALVEDQMAVLGDVRNQLAETFDDIG